MRKFADKEQSSNQANKQINVSNTEATLILCGYSGERANNQTNIEQYYREEDEEKKNEKICRQRTIKQINGSNTEATLILCGYSGERANKMVFLFRD